MAPLIVSSDTPIQYNAPILPPPVSKVQYVPFTINKGVHHSHFSAEGYLVIIREVSTSKAHVAALSKTRKLFEAAAEREHDNACFACI